MRSKPEALAAIPQNRTSAAWRPSELGGQTNRFLMEKPVRKAIALYEITRQKWDQLQAARKAALKKLTKEEIEALECLGAQRFLSMVTP
jgi:hypothetical protein